MPFYEYHFETHEFAHFIYKITESGVGLRRYLTAIFIEYFRWQSRNSVIWSSKCWGVDWPCTRIPTTKSGMVSYASIINDFDHPCRIPRVDFRLQRCNVDCQVSEEGNQKQFVLKKVFEIRRKILNKRLLSVRRISIIQVVNLCKKIEHRIEAMKPRIDRQEIPSLIQFIFLYFYMN